MIGRTIMSLKNKQFITKPGESVFIQKHSPIYTKERAIISPSKATKIHSPIHRSEQDSSIARVFSSHCRYCSLNFEEFSLFIINMICFIEGYENSMKRLRSAIYSKFVLFIVCEFLYGTGLSSKFCVQLNIFHTFFLASLYNSYFRRPNLKWGFVVIR